ncbi:MAG TPA: DUF885 domain-containing protein [Acidimicrobiia bacterium]|nr:DUF885 domain-containing protein [Acidimicrobiia bacterium]
MSSTPSAARLLADEFVEHRLATEHDWALWSGDLTYLERWPDVSEEGVRRQVEMLEDFARRAESIEASTSADRTLLETIAFTGRSNAAQLRWQPELEWVNHTTGIVSLIIIFLPRYPLVTAEHGERYLEKVRRLPEFIDTWIGRLEAAAEAGVTPIAHLVTAMVSSLDQQLAAPVSNGPLIRQPPPTDLSEAEAKLWTARLGVLLDDLVTPALQRLRAVLVERTAPAARNDTTPGLVHLPGGSELYEQLVWAHTSLAVSADEVHAIGRQQVERLEAEYRLIAGPLLDTTEIDEIYRGLRDDEELHYRDADSLVKDATAALAKATAAVSDWFGVLPKAPCIANSIEQGALAFYSRPARDGSKPGRFFFNTADPEMWGTFQLEAVTYHEGVPGHHLQLAIALENPELHHLLADYYIAAYNEGWGLYTERLADEMGLYSSDLDRVGMLSADSMRACRLVVDTGLHALGWSREQAIEYMVDHSPMTRLQVEGEIDRYIGNPGQALGYMMGRLEIEKIRSEAEATLADRFEIKVFHDVMLSTGSVPISTLKRVVKEWAQL